MVPARNGWPSAQMKDLNPPMIARRPALFIEWTQLPHILQRIARRLPAEHFTIADPDPAA